MTGVGLLGAGFVADLYMRSFRTFPEIKVLGVWDHDPARLAAFTAHWGLRAFTSLGDLIDAQGGAGLVLNLTNPGAHFETTGAVLDAGLPVWSEKPLAMSMSEVLALHDLARARGVQLGSAPASVLGQAAQGLMRAVRARVAGEARLIYADLDDGFIPQAPLEAWTSESGAPWPYADEFRTGCTLEHAGYYLSWLIGMFGSVRSVTAASAQVIPDKRGVTGAAPDFSSAVLFFENGPVARLTCSIAAPHDHRIRVIGDDGVLEVARAWDNAAPVRYRRRLRIRRRLLESPVARRLRYPGGGHPRVGRWGAASMNFALGPVEMLRSMAAGEESRLAGDYALHLNEVTLAIQNAGDHSGAQAMTTGCAPMREIFW